MKDSEWQAIRPGAHGAKELGCTCPVKQPHHKSHGAYFTNSECPVHAPGVHSFPSMGFVPPEISLQRTKEQG